MENFGQFPSTHTPSSQRKSPVGDPVGINKSTIRHVRKALDVEIVGKGHLKSLGRLVDFRNILRHSECLFSMR